MHDVYIRELISQMYIEVRSISWTNRLARPVHMCHGVACFLRHGVLAGNGCSWMGAKCNCKDEGGSDMPKFHGFYWLG